MSATAAMESRLQALEKRYEELSARLGAPDLLSDKAEFARSAKEHAELSPIVESYRAWKKIVADLVESESLAGGADKELAELAREEIKRLKGERDRIVDELARQLTPKDPHEGKTVLLEIRAGTGGDEAALFAGDLFRMYSKYAGRKGWQVNLVDSHPDCVAAAANHPNQTVSK